MNRQIERIEGFIDMIETVDDFRWMKVDIDALNSEEARKIKEQLLEAKNVVNKLEDTLLGLEEIFNFKDAGIESILSSEEKNYMLQLIEEIKMEVSSVEPEIEEKLSEIEKKIEDQSI